MMPGVDRHPARFQLARVTRRVEQGDFAAGALKFSPQFAQAFFIPGEGEAKGFVFPGAGSDQFAHVTGAQEAGGDARNEGFTRAGNDR